MERSPKRQTGRDPAWFLVRRWRKRNGSPLRGEAKLAWDELYELADYRLPCVVLTSAASIGAEIGTSERSGLRALDWLVAEGLLHVIEKVAGSWRVELRDPEEVARARGLVSNRPQRELPEIEQDREEDVEGFESDDDQILALRPAEPAAVSAQKPPPAPKPPHAYARADLRALDLGLNKTLDPRSSPSRGASSARGFEGSEDPRGGCGAETAATSADLSDRTAGPMSIGDSLAAAFAPLAQAIANPVTDARRRMTVIADTVALCREFVADPALRRKPMVRWGEAIADRRISITVLEQILGDLGALRAAGELRSAWKYFVFASMEAFHKHGIDWPRPEKPR